MEIDPSDLNGGKIAGATAGLFGLAWALRSFLRRVVRDWRDTRGEVAEIDILESWKQEAKEQRERADKAYSERNAAMQELGGLRAQVASLQAVVEELRFEVARLRAEVNGGTR